MQKIADDAEDVPVDCVGELDEGLAVLVDDLGETVGQCSDARSEQEAELQARAGNRLLYAVETVPERVADCRLILCQDNAELLRLLAEIEDAGLSLVQERK
ncbi:MAG: hypothetical protein E5X24_08370 [Mesorhizobium sp.]|nr:MAG: hypothetical protein E5X24_08370 [Mesorhizobium sp.]